MFIKINSRVKAIAFGLIFLLSWLPLLIYIILYLLSSMHNYLDYSKITGIIFFTSIPLIVMVTPRLFTMNFFIFIGNIHNYSYFRWMQIFFVLFLILNILFLRPYRAIANFKLLTSALDSYEKNAPKDTYVDCKGLLNGPNVSGCANIVLSKTGDLKGCLELSLAIADDYYPNKNWDKNGFHCKISGNIKACEDYVASPLKDSKLYRACVDSVTHSYDASILSSPDLDQIIADHDASFKAKKKAEAAKISFDQLKLDALAKLPPATPKFDLVDLVDFDIFFDKNKADLFGQKLACTESFVFRYPSTEKPVNLFLPCSNFSDFYYHRDKLYKYTENQDIAHNDATLSQWQSAWESDKVSRQEFYKNFSESPKRILELGSAGNIKKQSVRDFNLLKKNNQPDQSYYTLSIANYPTLIYPDTYNFWLVFVNSVNINTGLVPAVNYYVLFNDYDQQLSCDNYQQDLGQTLSVVSFDGQRIKLDGQGTLKCDNGNNIEYRLDFDNENNFLEIK